MVWPCVARGFHRSVGFAVWHQCIRADREVCDWSADAEDAARQAAITVATADEGEHAVRVACKRLSRGTVVTVAATSKGQYTRIAAMISPVFSGNAVK